MVSVMPSVSEPPLRLRKPPIVEAVFDLACSMPEGFDVQKIEAQAVTLLRHRYPTVRPALMLEQSFVQQPGKEPAMSSRQILRGYQFLSEDLTRIIQFRLDGFSFNKLAPYSVLGDYLPEIRESWEVFIRLCNPSLVTRVSLRNINRIQVKQDLVKVEIGDYLKVGPHLHDEKNLTFTGFLNHHQALEKSTGNHVNVITTTQAIGDGAPALILDIEAYRQVAYKPNATDIWENDLPSIRSLKDRVFSNTLTPECLKTFEPF